MIIPQKEYVVISTELLDAANRDDIKRVAVRLIIQKNKSLLMLKRVPESHFPDIYELPGGGLNEGEDIFSGAQRELHEETGLSIVSFDSVIEIIDFIHVSDESKGRQYIFSVESGNEEIILNPKEHTAYAWVSFTDIDTIDMLPKTKNIVRKVLQ